MKKFLSLVLALVMTMSLVTVSAGAKDFTDDSKINYEEAVAVMSEVKVIDGYTDGSFNPQGSLTRGAAAKIICNLILGPTTAAELSADTAPFSDVATNHTFAGYIAYCSKEGIINGYADGTFRPAAPLTGYAFMKMLLGSLGYDSQIEGFVGPNWSINVAKRALGIGLNKGLTGEFNGVTNVNREEACLYALNTMKATMVEYETKTTVNVGGAEVVIGNSVATDVKWNIAKNTDGNIKEDGYVQFAESYFPKLELEIGNGIYGRPTNVWKNKKAEIGSFTSIDATKVYTETTKEEDIYKDLGKAVCDTKEYDWSAYVNGEPVAAKALDVVTKTDADYSYTGEGTVTEIYVDDDAETVTVCEINYYLGQVSKVKSDDDGEYIVMNALSKEPKLDEKTFYAEGYNEDDYVVFTVDYNDDKDFVIGEVMEPEVVSAEVTRVEQDKDSEDTYLKADGEKYTYTDKGHIVYDLDKYYTEEHPALSEEYNLYLDPNGYVLAFAIAEETIDQYLYVIDSDEEMGDWEAKVLLATGEVKKVAVDDEFADGKEDVAIDWLNADKRMDSNIDEQVWKYTVNSKDVYELTKVDSVEFGTPKVNDKYVGEIHNGKAYITDGNDDIIVDKKTTFVDYDNETAYIGYKEVPDVDNAHGFYVMDENVATVVFILDGVIYDANSTYFMLTKTDRESLKFDGKYFWDYSKAYVAGDKQNVVVSYDALNNGDKLKAGVLYKATKSNSEGYFTEIEAVTGRIGTDVVMAGSVTAVGDETFWITAEKNQKRKFDTNDETVFVYVETDEDGDISISEGNINDMKDQDDFETTVWVVKASNEKETADLVYIFADSTEAPAKDKGNLEYKVELNGDEFTVSYYSAYADEADAYDALEAVKEYLADEDYKNISVKRTGNTFTLTAEKRGVAETFTFDVADDFVELGMEVVVIDQSDATGAEAVTAPLVDHKYNANVKEPSGKWNWENSFPDELTYTWILGNDQVICTERSIAITSDMAGKQLTLVVSSDNVDLADVTWTAEIAQ